jgi:hypothetical protein
MTVNELIAALQELVEQGHGDVKVFSDHNVVEEAYYVERLDEVYV